MPRALLLAITGLLLLGGCGSTSQPSQQASQPRQLTTSTAAAPSAVDPGYNTCHYVYPNETQGLPNRAELVLPDPVCTPGASNGEDQIKACAKEPPRPDLSQFKLKLLVRYGQAKTLTAAKQVAGRYELDHLVMRWAGGADSEANLWPEPHPTPNAKDGLEWQLHDRVCQFNNYPGGVAQARKDISVDWVKLWLQMGRPSAQAGHTVAD